MLCYDWTHRFERLLCERKIEQLPPLRVQFRLYGIDGVEISSIAFPGFVEVATDDVDTGAVDVGVCARAIEQHCVGTDTEFIT